MLDYAYMVRVIYIVEKATEFSKDNLARMWTATKMRYTVIITLFVPVQY